MRCVVVLAIKPLRIIFSPTFCKFVSLAACHLVSSSVSFFQHRSLIHWIFWPPGKFFPSSPSIRLHPQSPSASRLSIRQSSPKGDHGLYMGKDGLLTAPSNATSRLNVKRIVDAAILTLYAWAIITSRTVYLEVLIRCMVAFLTFIILEPLYLYRRPHDYELVWVIALLMFWREKGTLIKS